MYSRLASLVLIGFAALNVVVAAPLAAPKADADAGEHLFFIVQTVALTFLQRLFHVSTPRLMSIWEP